MRSRKIEKKVATVITQVEVSKDDRAFENPTKPIGSFYDKETAEKLAKEKSFTMVEDAGRGYRRVVPSPKPAELNYNAIFDTGCVGVQSCILCVGLHKS